jgi:hypothetical protein
MQKHRMAQGERSMIVISLSLSLIFIAPGIGGASMVDGLP